MLNIYKKKTNKKKIIAILLAVIMIMLCAIPGCLRIVGTNNVKQYGLVAPDIEFSDSDNFEEYHNDMVAIDAVTSMKFRSGELEQSICISNNEHNSCAMVVSLFLSDGSLLFATDPLLPGDCAETTILQKALSIGRYSDAVLVYDILSNDDDMRLLTRCEFIIDIESV